MGSCQTFYIKLAPGERIDMEVAVPTDERSLITGRVADQNGDPVPSTPVLVLDAESVQPVGHCFTDSQGIFAIGPLEGEKLYIINIYDRATPIRTIEIKL